MKKSEMLESLEVMESMYGEGIISEPMLNGWYSIFGDLDKATFEYMIKVTVQQPGRKFSPKPGEIMETLIKHSKPSKPCGEEVWSVVVAYASAGDENGVMEYVSDNRAAQVALRSVSFHAIRYSDIETELKWVRKDFINAYNSVADNDEQDELAQIGADGAKKILQSLEAKNIKFLK